MKRRKAIVETQKTKKDIRSFFFSFQGFEDFKEKIKVRTGIIIDDNSALSRLSVLDLKNKGKKVEILGEDFEETLKRKNIKAFQPNYPKDGIIYFSVDAMETYIEEETRVPNDEPQLKKKVEKKEEEEEEEDENIQSLKIILLGDSGVGKSSILERYIHRKFTPHNVPTIGVEYAVKKEMIDKSKFSFQIWDTAGQEKYRSVVRSYPRGCAGVFFVYDLTQKKIDPTERMKKDLEYFELIGVRGPCVVPIVVVGCKLDLENQPFSDELMNYCEEINANLMKCSAKSGEGVDEAFLTLFKKSVKFSKITKEMEKEEEISRIPDIEEMNRIDSEKKKKSGCC